MSEQNLSWELLKEEPYKAGYRKMLRRTFRMPDGAEELYDIRESGRVVCILPFISQNTVVIARQFRPGPLKVLLELPGGGVEANEDPTRAAERELVEETGYRGELVHLGASYDDGYSTMVRHHFVALNCKKVQEPQPDRTEFIKPEEISLDMLKDLIRKGGLTDSNTALRGLWYSGLL